jgi:hypothetical protein
VHGALGAAFSGHPGGGLHILGNLVDDHDSMAFVISVYKLGSFGIAPAVTNARTEIDLQAHVTMLTGAALHV